MYWNSDRTELNVSTKNMSRHLLHGFQWSRPRSCAKTIWWQAFWKRQFVRMLFLQPQWSRYLSLLASQWRDFPFVPSLPVFRLAKKKFKLWILFVFFSESTFCIFSVYLSVCWWARLWSKQSFRYLLYLFVRSYFALWKVHFFLCFEKK